MKTKITKEMAEKIKIGVIVSAFTLILFFVLTNFNIVGNIWSTIISVLFPFIIGFSLAFLLNPIMMFFENKIFKKWICRGKLKRTISMLIALIIAVIIIALLVCLIVPAVVDSVSDLVLHNESYIKKFTTFITNVFENFNLDTSRIDEVVGKGSSLITNFGGIFSRAIPSIISTSYGIIKTVLNLFIGIAAAMYLLLDKEIFINNVKKINFAYLPRPVALYLKRLVNVIKKVFYDFIVGKAIDSLIIGIICYIGLSILGIKYAALLSVIIGVTNMIPVFGPFIGAVPGIIILIIIQPIQALYFAIFVFALQQFDGSILGPLILGDKLGLPSFWILFSVTIGGAFMGITGMFIGVPTFAIIYYGIKEYTDFRIEQKQINMSED